MIKLVILGNNSAVAAYDRHPTAQLLSIRDQSFLIDCGENTQNQMKKYGVSWRKINTIFISHLHGDHYFGLIGLITSMALLGRSTELHLYGPPQLKNIIDLQLNVANTLLPYSLHFHPIIENDNYQLLIDTVYYSVHSFPVEHRIPCHGFLFTAKQILRKIQPEQCRAYGIPTAFYKRLQQGENYIDKNGQIIENKWVTISGKSDITYAYCADTRYTESFLPHIQHATAIYHESTYLHEEKEKAHDRFHSTAIQAAKIAKKAKTKQLLLGHFSSKYKDLQAFESEAKTVFNNSIVTKEGMTFEWNNDADV